MIKETAVLITETTNPFENLALEEVLLMNLKDAQCILYLWQNEHTVVIGKNQNAWKECRIDRLNEEQGKLARRMSGGGAVYHDLGNLNFTFFLNQEDYDVAKQLSVIQKALKHFQVEAKLSGRNDLVVEDRKISGNAFYQSKGRCLQHGTLLVNVDKEKMNRYLNPSWEKLQSKGVASVQSRVANLNEFNSQITIQGLKQALEAALDEVYPAKRAAFEISEEMRQQWASVCVKYQSFDWRLGQRIGFEKNVRRRFGWGEIEISMRLDRGRIKELNLYSDAMELNLLEQLKIALLDCEYLQESLQKRMNSLFIENETEKKMKQDILNCLIQEEVNGKTV